MSETSDEGILTAQQRQETAAWLGDEGAAAASDEELLTRAAERIGLEGELAVDAEGALELERDNLLVILESVADEDAELVDHPDQLYLSIYVRPGSDAERQAWVDADLLEEEAEAVGDEGWTYAWWGGMCTQLPRTATLPAQLEALHRTMNEAAAVLERQDLPTFFKRMKWLEQDTED